MDMGVTSGNVLRKLTHTLYVPAEIALDLVVGLFVYLVSLRSKVKQLKVAVSRERDAKVAAV